MNPVILRKTDRSFHQKQKKFKILSRSSLKLYQINPPKSEDLFLRYLKYCLFIYSTYNQIIILYIQFFNYGWPQTNCSKPKSRCWKSSKYQVNTNLVHGRTLSGGFCTLVDEYNKNRFCYRAWDYHSCCDWYRDLQLWSWSWKTLGNMKHIRISRDSYKRWD